MSPPPGRSLHTGSSRVQEWRGGLGAAYRSGPFVGRGFTSRTMPRFHSPLIEPGGRISRTRLSDQISGVRSREAGQAMGQPDQPQPVAQVGFGVAQTPRTLNLM